MNQALERRLSRLTAELRRMTPCGDGKIQFVISPYRICPLGAHIDHQGGPVLGMTIDLYTVLAFVPVERPEVEILSLHHGETARFPLNCTGSPVSPPWANYAAAAARALGAEFRLQRGFCGVVDGDLPGGGLSSSASVGLAYLLALAGANSLDVGREELVRLDQRLENDFLGLQNGILDQSTIVFGRRDHLLLIETEEMAVTPLPSPQGRRFRFVVFYSGISRQLVNSGFNDRVAECRAAAKRLARRAGLPPADRLGKIPAEVFDQFKAHLPQALRRRAAHFFSESARVRQGAEAWRGGDLQRFGELMNASCRSSIHQYECGSAPLQELWELASARDGILGARFSGGGYGGCVVALVEAGAEASVSCEVLEAYRERWPEFGSRAFARTVSSEDGVRRL